jgi:hypothetical protein
LELELLELLSERLEEERLEEDEKQVAYSQLYTVEDSLDDDLELEDSELKELDEEEEEYLAGIAPKVISLALTDVGVPDIPVTAISEPVPIDGFTGEWIKSDLR